MAEAKSPRDVRWSAKRKADAVVRLLRGESLDVVSRELRVEAHRLAAWRDEFIAGGVEGLKAQPLAPDDRRLRDAERKIGELTMENEILRAAVRKRGLQCRRGSGRSDRRARCRPSHGVSGAPSPPLYGLRSPACRPGRDCGQAGAPHRVDDDTLLDLIRHVIADSPFAGEGHRKVTARLRREHDVRVGRKRVLRLMRKAGLLAPQRARGRRRPRPHDGTIIPPAPNLLWGTDATMAHTVADGWVWVFVCVDHASAEAWASVAPRGDRFAALEPIYEAVQERFGALAPDIARGVACRHDWGPRYISGHFQGSLRWLGIADSPAFAGEPSCNGCAERFVRTLKEQCLWALQYRDVAELRAAVTAFVERYNAEWLIERHGHRTPREAYAAATAAQAA